MQLKKIVKKTQLENQVKVIHHVNLIFIAII